MFLRRLQLGEALVERRVGALVERIVFRQELDGPGQVLRGERRIDVLAELALRLRAGDVGDARSFGGRLFRRRRQIFQAAADLFFVLACRRRVAGAEQREQRERRGAGIGLHLVRIADFLVGVRAAAPAAVGMLGGDEPGDAFVDKRGDLGGLDRFGAAAAWSVSTLDSAARFRGR